MELCGLVFGTVLALGLVIFTYFKWAFTYWDRKNLRFVPPSIPFGNLQNPFRRTRSMAFDIVEAYNTLKSEGCKHAGFYAVTNPNYLLIDPEYVKIVMTRDFQFFSNHSSYLNEKDDPLSAHLFALKDERWRNLRAKLTPTFTSGKMKAMFQTLLDCSVPLTGEIERLCVKREPLDIKELVARFSTDVIGSCAFGVECNSFKDPDAEFRKYGKMVFTSSAVRKIKISIILALPDLAKKLRLTLNHPEVSEFFMGMVQKTVGFREENGTTRRDLMQLLIDLKNGGLTMNEISAQAFVFFLAGFETSSTTMNYALFELAKNQGCQDKVRKDIEDVLKKHDGKITYDSIGEMKYLDQVIDETLRKYPPVPILDRMCTKAYKVPGTDLIIEKGTKVLIPCYALQHDPEYFPDPTTFNPDRFSEENKEKIVPFTYMPFGDGPRNCIGSRFGKMQVRCGLVAILRNFRVKLNPKTPTTLKMDPNAFILMNKDTVYLDVERISSS